jgi:hypothetical protein
MLTKANGDSIGENVVVGGENSWACDSFVNYDFLPSEKFPILVYFKETQTPRSNWVEAPIVVDDKEGQVHSLSHSLLLTHSLTLTHSGSLLSSDHQRERTSQTI